VAAGDEDAIPLDLCRPEAHPADPDPRRVEHVQTHISHVFLTRERVYKLRKSVDLGFLDFSTREARNADCLREVALNRRLAPRVYLGVAPVVREAGRWRVGEVGEELAGDDGRGGVPEHCVVMCRLPAGTDALSRLQAGEFGSDEVDRVAARVAHFHDENGLGTPAPFSTEAWLERITAPVAANFESLGSGGTDPALRSRARDAARRFEKDHADRFERRRRAGRAVDGHGDLHLDHIWFAGGADDPLLIDCIEFSETLRCIDAASDVAFLAMDLAYRGRSDLGERFLRRYASERDDFDLYGVVDYYVAYRAGVRAKVAALAAGDEDIPEAQRRAAAESAERHLALAADTLERPESGVLVVISGTVGAGKSTLAELAADALDGVVVASDRVRKRQAGLALDERGGEAAGLYDAAHTERTYAALLERAAPIASSGRAVVLDATHAKARHREAARAWGRERGLAVILAEARCAEAVALARLEHRQREGRDPSDAGPELLARSRAGFEPAAEWPASDRIAIRTDVEDWRSGAAEDLRALVARRGPGPGTARG
jgi:hypothetical protein